MAEMGTLCFSMLNSWSILKDSDLERSNAPPVDEALALSLQGVASVSSYVLSCLFPF